MIPTTTFLRTRLARRILGLFMLGALVPVGVVGVVAYRHVGSQLQDQMRTRVFQSSKAHGMAILERLHFLETELSTASHAVLTNPDSLSPWETLAAFRSRFKSLALVTEDRLVDLGGEALEEPSVLSPMDSAHLQEGKSVLALNGPSRNGIYLAVALDPEDLRRGILWTEVEPAYLWRPDLANPEEQTCVYAGSLMLYCSSPRYARSVESQLRGENRRTGGTFEWRYRDERFVAGHWPIFLKYSYRSPAWTLVQSEPRAVALASLANFKRTFPLILLLTLAVIFLLSNVQIRRSMDPLVKLQEGTKRIAASQFDTRVEVTSRDEFEDLAGSFNTMTLTLGKQFKTLNVINEIDKRVLSALDSEVIIDSVLSRFTDVVPCDAMSITVAPSGRGEPWKYVAVATVERYRITRDIRLIEDEIKELEDHPDHLILGRHMGLRSYLNDAEEVATRRTCSIVLPLFTKGRLIGIIALDYFNAPELARDDLVQARQLADQVAVALANTRLISDLDQLSWGTLTALARTIDANSPWTAGHSERVTTLAVRLGKELGLQQDQLDTLHRGALLHDIGKIGTPHSILNKPGPLTEEERRIVQEHTTVGAKILAPIGAFSEAIPLVRNHHEWFDGAGYPDGLGGEEIPYLARLLAVPDVYDALTSNRPYRAGWTHREAIEYIDHCAGTQFDPAMATMFIKFMKDEAQVEALVRRESEQSPGLKIVTASEGSSSSRKAVS